MFAIWMTSSGPVGHVSLAVIVYHCIVAALARRGGIDR